MSKLKMKVDAESIPVVSVIADGDRNITLIATVNKVVIHLGFIDDDGVFQLCFVHQPDQERLKDYITFDRNFMKAVA
jgi:hypothetical protein